MSIFWLFWKRGHLVSFILEFFLDIFDWGIVLQKRLIENVVDQYIVNNSRAFYRVKYQNKIMMETSDDTTEVLPVYLIINII